MKTPEVRFDPAQIPAIHPGVNRTLADSRSPVKSGSPGKSLMNHVRARVARGRTVRDLGGLNQQAGAA
jgi:hypothetical protein